MIRPIDIRLNAAHPELPLCEAVTFTGSPSTVLIRGVPPNCGRWAITAVFVVASFPDGSTTTRAAVQSANGVWVATLPATATSGRTVAGFKILADGIDENGAAVTGYILGFADFAVLSFFPVPAPGETFFYLRYFDTMPTTPKKGDVAKMGGVLEFYNGTAWEAFDVRAYALATQASNNANDLRRTLTANYYTSAQTDEAIERVAAYYITYNAAGAAFPTRADLINAQTYYSGGVVRVPTRNDYAVVLADETHDGAEWRYIYSVADGETTGQWEPQYPVEGVIAYDNTVTPTSGNGVKSSGIWSAIWGALSALPAGFSSLYDWVVSKLSEYRDKTDLNVYVYGIAYVTFPAGYSITYGGVTYSTETGKGIEFYGPISSTAVPQYNFWVPYEYKDATDFNPQAQTVWCLYGSTGSSIPATMMYGTGATYYIANWDTEAPTLTLSNGEATGGEPTMTRPLSATGDTLAKASQLDSKLDKRGGEMTPTFTTPAIPSGRVVFGRDAGGPFLGLAYGQNTAMLRPNGVRVNDRNTALAAPNPTAGNLAALDANGNPTDAGIAAGDLLTIVTLSDSTETMASILARLNAINAAHKHVFFDCSGIDVNPRLYLCTIMIDADANAVRVYDQVTGKLYIGPYDATETIGEVFAKAVDAYHSITVSAVTLDGVTVTGQTVTIREGTDATAPVYATATITDGAPVVFVVPKGMIYFLEITDTLADHFGPRVTSGAKQGIATADAAVTFTYYDAEHIDVSEITTFAKLQEALTWFGTNEAAARNNLVGVEIADTWTATNGTVYDNPRVVWDVHYFEDENGVSHLGALMGTKYCSHNDVVFDAAEGEECDSATETTAEADVYYYGLALGQTSKTAANLTLLELSEGDALPYADYAKIYKSAIRDTTRNSLQYGYNNWRDSAYRQYLNSDAAAGQWWGATHIGDIAPSQLNSVRGFMAGCSAALLAAAKKVKVATWPNSVTDGPNQITTLYETLDTFFLPSGSEVYGNVNESGGASVEGELSPYWQARTGYTSPNNTATSTRIIYRELPVGSTANRSAAAVRLRSANRGYSSGVWLVTTSGQVSNNNADYAYASVPACVIY